MIPAGGRIVAIDVRARRIGYAVFDSPTRLLEWGMRADAQRRTGWTGDLIHLYQPFSLVLRAIKRGGTRDTPGARQILRIIRAESRLHSIPVTFITDDARRRFFSEAYGLKTRYQVAPLLAAKFPELKAKLPPPKKTWKPVPRRMSVFDAVQAGFVFLALSASENSRQNT